MDALPATPNPEIDNTAPSYDRANDCYHVTHDADGSATITETVIHAIATVAGSDVSESEFSLYDSIDPDALETLFADRLDGTPRSMGHVCFTVLEYTVYVHACGDVYVYPPK